MLGRDGDRQTITSKRRAQILGTDQSHEQAQEQATSQPGWQGGGAPDGRIKGPEQLKGNFDARYKKNGPQLLKGYRAWVHGKAERPPLPAQIHFGPSILTSLGFMNSGIIFTGIAIYLFQSHTTEAGFDEDFIPFLLMIIFGVLGPIIVVFSPFFFLPSKNYTLLTPHGIDSKALFSHTVIAWNAVLDIEIKKNVSRNRTRTSTRWYVKIHYEPKTTANRQSEGRKTFTLTSNRVRLYSEEDAQALVHMIEDYYKMIKNQERYGG